MSDPSPSGVTILTILTTFATTKTAASTGLLDFLLTYVPIFIPLHFVHCLLIIRRVRLSTTFYSIIATRMVIDIRHAARSSDTQLGTLKPGPGTGGSARNSRLRRHSGATSQLGAEMVSTMSMSGPVQAIDDSATTTSELNSQSSRRSPFELRNIPKLSTLRISLPAAPPTAAEREAVYHVRPNVDNNPRLVQ
jgi:hypothetical protein